MAGFQHAHRIGKRQFNSSVEGNRLARQKDRLANRVGIYGGLAARSRGSACVQAGLVGAEERMDRTDISGRERIRE